MGKNPCGQNGSECGRKFIFGDPLGDAEEIPGYVAFRKEKKKKKRKLRTQLLLQSRLNGGVFVGVITADTISQKRCTK